MARGGGDGGFGGGGGSSAYADAGGAGGYSGGGSSASNKFYKSVKMSSLFLTKFASQVNWKFHKVISDIVDHNFCQLFVIDSTSNSWSTVRVIHVKFTCYFFH